MLQWCFWLLIHWRFITERLIWISILTWARLKWLKQNRLMRNNSDLHNDILHGICCTRCKWINITKIFHWLFLYDKEICMWLLCRYRSMREYYWFWYMYYLFIWLLTYILWSRNIFIDLLFQFICDDSVLCNVHLCCVIVHYWYCRWQ